MSDKKILSWPMIIAGLLTVHVAASLFFVYLATSNPSFAVEEDYYRKALRWDEKRAQDAANDDLGWQLVTDVTATEGSDAMLRVRLTDAAGEAVEGASITCEAFPIARADEIFRAALRSAGKGTYETSMSVHRPGRWELRFVVSRAADRFTHVAVEYLATQRPR